MCPWSLTLEEWASLQRRDVSWCRADFGGCEQVAERLIGCMGRPQLVRLAVVAHSVPGVSAGAVERIAAALQQAAPHLATGDVLRLSDVVATSAHRDGGVVMALAARLLTCNGGAHAGKVDAALRRFRADGFLLPLEVQARLGAAGAPGRFQLRDVMPDVTRLQLGAPEAPP